MQAKQFPASAIVVRDPATIEHVRESKVPVRRCRRGQRLPALQLVARTAEADNSADLLKLGEARRCRRTVRTPGHDHVVPPQSGPLFVEEVTPVALRVLLVEPFHELKRAFHHAVGLRDVDVVAEVLTGCRFKSNVPAAVLANGVFATAQREPPVGIVRLNGVQAVRVQSIK